MPFLILSVIIQVAFVLHIVKTGRNTTWIWIVVMLPMAGAIAYLLLEVLPDLAGSRGGREASAKVKSVLNPNKDLNTATRNFGVSDNVENSMKLAEECYNKGLYDDAKDLYQKCLSGLYADDPTLMFGLARSDFALGQYADTKTTLDELIKLNPDYKNQDAHLLYARTLESLGDTDEALHEYETLHGYFAGPDASFYFGKFLKAQGQPEKARAVFEGIIEKAGQLGKPYKAMHKEVIRRSKAEVAG